MWKKIKKIFGGKNPDIRTDLSTKKSVKSIKMFFRKAKCHFIYRNKRH